VRTGLGGPILCSHLKICFKKNLDQNMLETALFFGKKNGKIAAGSATNHPPLASGC